MVSRLILRSKGCSRARPDEAVPDQSGSEDCSGEGALAGAPTDVSDFRKWLATMKEGPIFQRIEISYAGE